MKKIKMLHLYGGRMPFSKRCLFALLMMFTFNMVRAQDNTWFKDVSGQVGFHFVHVGAMISLDVNNDDYPDLITIYSLQVDTGWRLYINQQDPNTPNDPKARVFVDATQASGINEPGRIKDMGCAADFNNDGNVDIVVSTWYMDSTVNGQVCVSNPDNNSRMRILLGNGQGHFTHKSNSNLESLGAGTNAGIFALDYDKDGKLDMYAVSHYKNWCYGVPKKSFLLHGNGDGTFTDVSAASGINYDPLPLFGGNVTDWNNDCQQDIFTAPYTVSGHANLFKNNGDGTFADVGATAGYDPHFMAGDNGQAMVPWAAMPADYDNDGDMDFFVLEVHGGTGSNEGRSTIFTNGGAANNYKLTPNLNQITRNNPQNSHHGDHNGFWSDFDNDGWADIIVGDAVYALSPSSDGQRMFFCLQNSTTHQFNDITKNLGFITGNTVATISDRIRRPGCMLPIDYDNDGDDDIFKAPYNSDDSVNFLVLKNDIANKNHFIKIKLLAPAGVNKNCIGARVRVKADNVWQIREVYANQGSWTNQYPFVLNFGIGSSTHIDSIDVRWPDAACSHTVLKNISGDQFITIDKNGLSVADAKSVDKQIQVYPNPVTNELIIHASEPLTRQKIVIRNIQGQIVEEVVLHETDRSINTSRWPSGTYLVQCYDGEKYTTVKIVKIN